MRSVAEFAYGQARIQARHGDRLRDSDWRNLESAQSLSRYLELARSTSLKRFLAEISPDLSAHTIERVLRREVALYAADIAAFAPRRWRPAIAWLAALPLLPLVEGFCEGASRPGWLSDDATLGPLSASRTYAPDAVVPGLARLVDDAGAPAEIGHRWLCRWRALWPEGDAADADLRRVVGEILRTLGSAGGRREESGQSFRRHLVRTLTRFFRSHVASPVALVCHVGLVLIDVERLRGGLIRRSLFGDEEERIAT